MKELVLLPVELRELLEIISEPKLSVKVRSFISRINVEQYCQGMHEQGYLVRDEKGVERDVLQYRLSVSGKFLNEIFQSPSPYESVSKKYQKGIFLRDLNSIYSINKSIEKTGTIKYEDETQMRLSHAARKLNVGEKTIVAFLASRGYKVDSESSGRIITSNMYSELMKEFKKNRQEQGSSFNGLTTIKTARNRLIQFARKQLPHGVRHVVRIPATSGTNYLSLQNTQKPEVLQLVLERWEQKTVSTSIGANTDLPGVQNIEIFNKRFNEINDITEIIGDLNIDDYLVEQERTLQKNIKVALNHEKSRIAILIKMYNEEYSSNEKRSFDSTFDNTFGGSMEAITIQNQLQLATLNSDSVKGGEDLLGFDQDINAFAAIIALKELTPPLAIALFGEWGSGKSFFMQSLSNKIDFISENQNFEVQSEAGSRNKQELNGPFCKGVCQIHFNAWSYTDTNLWASLVSGIFEGLESYITKNKKKEVTKDKIEKELSQKLELAREQESKLNKIKETKLKEVESLEAQRDTKTKEENAAIERIKTLTLGSLIEEAKKELEATPTFNALKESVDQFGISDQKIRKWSPSNVLQELTSWKTFALVFFKVRPWQWVRFLGVVALFFLSPFIVELTQLNWDLTLFSTLGISGTAIIAVWEKARQTLNKLNPIITEVVNYKDQYETRMADLISARDQQVESEKLKIVQGQMEITHLNSKLDVISKEISQLEYSLKSSLSQKALYSFIVERSKSQDYERHLGIISTIRRDFETLSELFIGNVTEIQTYDNLLEKEKKKSIKDFRNQFDRPLERIILYIDDLDRCPEDRVVEVLEAVNLLMAFPLFVVVVGVDPRWVENALIQKYQLQFTGQLRNQSNEISKSLKVIQASDYLEKIFQIPFHLKSASDESVKGMITHLVGDTKEDADANTYTSKDNSFLSRAIKDSLNRVPNIPQSSSSSVKKLRATDVEKVVGTGEDNASIILESLKLHQVELDHMKELSWIIGDTPRTIKRFVNTYRIIRAHEGLSYKNDDEKSELLALMFLLALRTGRYKEFYLKAKPMFQQDHSGADLNTMLKNEIKILNNDSISMDTSSKVGYQNLLWKLMQSEGLQGLKNMKVSKFKSHCSFIERFSFQTSKIEEFLDFSNK